LSNLTCGYGSPDYGGIGGLTPKYQNNPIHLNVQAVNVWQLMTNCHMQPICTRAFHVTNYEVTVTTDYLGIHYSMSSPSKIEW